MEGVKGPVKENCPGLKATDVVGDSPCRGVVEEEDQESDSMFGGQSLEEPLS